MKILDLELAPGVTITYLPDTGLFQVYAGGAWVSVYLTNREEVETALEANTRTIVHE